MKFNNRKFQILSLFDEYDDELTSRDVRDILGITLHNASMLLGNYYEQRLLDRRKEPQETNSFIYFYRLSPKGKKRLKYFREKL